jgi:hypothetical protein
VKGKVVTPEVSVPASGSVSEASKVKTEEKKEQLTCGQCRFWDTTTTRDFHRDGIREGLVECRSTCRNPEARAFKHLTKKETAKECCVPGVFVAEKKEKKPETGQVETEQKEQPTETKVQPTKGKVQKSSIEVNKLNGHVARLETNRKGLNDRKVYVEVAA